MGGLILPYGVDLPLRNIQFDVGDKNESINDYDNDSLTLKQTYSYDYIGCDDQFVEKYQSLKKQLDYIDK